MPAWVTTVLEDLKIFIYLVINIGIDIVGLVVFVAILLRVFRVHWREIVSTLRSLIP